MNAIFEDNYKVRISDSDRYGKLKPPALLQMIQEIATDHAKDLKVDIDSLSKLNLSWALSKIIINIDKIPENGERVYIKTWPSFREKITTYREFQAVDKDGKSLFTVRSQWILFDKTARRLTRMDRLHQWPLNPIASNNAEFEQLPKPTEDSIISSFEARNDDIDMNQHVNNTVFLIWTLESLPTDFLKINEPKSIKINFLEEVFLKSPVETSTQISDNQTITSLKCKTSNHECARVLINWQTKA